jgi:hypothetical protein
MSDDTTTNNNNISESTTARASSNDSHSPSRARRSSIAGDTLAGLFGGARGVGQTRSVNDNVSNDNPASLSSSQTQEGPITSAARRLSMTTFGGLSAASGANGHNRRESTLSASVGGLNESAIDEDEPLSADPSVSQTPFSRRMSSNARSLREVRSNSMAGGKCSLDKLILLPTREMVLTPTSQALPRKDLIGPRTSGPVPNVHPPSLQMAQSA